MDEEVIGKFRRAGKAAAAGLRFGAGLIREGASMLEVAERTEGCILDQGDDVGLAFPCNIAIDDVAAHFTPLSSDKGLHFEKGQLVKLDCGAHVDGHIGDTAVTIEVGTNNYGDLIRASREALETAIDMIAPRVRLTNVGEAGVVFDHLLDVRAIFHYRHGAKFDDIERLQIKTIAGLAEQGGALAVEPDSDHE